MITVDDKQLQYAKDVLQHIPKAAPKAIARAINRAATRGKIVAIDKATEDYYVNKKDVRATIKVTQARPERLTAFIRSTNTRRELKHSLVLPNLLPSHKTRQGPFIAQKRETSPKHSPGTFINNGSKTGKPHVFTRIRGQRMPRIKYGLSIPQMLGSNNVKEFVEHKSIAFLNERLEHEIDVILQGVVK